MILRKVTMSEYTPRCLHFTPVNSILWKPCLGAVNMASDHVTVICADPLTKSPWPEMVRTLSKAVVFLWKKTSACWQIWYRMSLPWFWMMIGQHWFENCFCTWPIFNTLRPKKMVAISHMTVLSAISSMKMYKLRLKFYWSVFLRGVQFTII